MCPEPPSAGPQLAGGNLHAIERGNCSQPQRGGNHGPYTILPLPKQDGAPFSVELIRFVDEGQNLSMGWTEDQQINA